MRFLLGFLLLIATFADAETLRISMVRETAGEDAERMVLHFEAGGQPKEEVVFVRRETVVGDADVARASVSPGHEIAVELTPEGAKKMAKASGTMIHGRDRLAVIVDGKLIMAPVVQSKLGGNFVISGLRELDARGLENLARRMSGRPLMAPNAEAPPVPPPTRVVTVPYTEEEYLQIKARRENAGIFYLESIPTKEELDAMLLKGMRLDEVIAVLGKPSMSVGKAEDASFRLAYEFAPEKRAENPEGVMLKNGFHVLFSGGELTGWDFSHSNQPPERKVVGQVPGLLVASIPEVDLGAGEVDLVAYVESIKIPDIRQKVNATDLYGLLSLVTMISTINQEKEERSVSAGCDVLKILAIHFSEVEGLAAKSVDGRIVIRKLESVLSPYARGVKPLPEMKAEPSGVR